MSLVDTEKEEFVHNFAQEHNEIFGAVFSAHIPGAIMTVNAVSPIITLWNVSQKTPVEKIKIPHRVDGMVGIHAVDHEYLKKRKKENGGVSSSSVPDFILAFADGGVGTYSYSSRRLLSCSEGAHSETIFDCRFKNSSPDILATASYDGRIKIWDTVQMKCVRDLVGQTGVLYGVSWAPGDATEHRLASSSSKGEVFIWDTNTGQVLKKLKNHGNSSFRISWNQNNARYIASTSSDKTCVVFTPEGELLKKLKHPDAVYGVEWDPFQELRFCTGCADGIVRVFSMTKSSATIELMGHSRRVFNTVWSPLVPGVIASGSDDCTIRIWQVETRVRPCFLFHSFIILSLFYCFNIVCWCVYISVEGWSFS